jgi:hypothetical protein
VNAWGVIRSTKDIDICPSPDAQNLQRLADLLSRKQHYCSVQIGS